MSRYFPNSVNVCIAVLHIGHCILTLDIALSTIYMLFTKLYKPLQACTIL